MQALAEPAPGQYWKTPFIWEPGCPVPAATPSLRFEPAGDEWLQRALAEVLSDSLDEGARHSVAQLGAAQAVAELLGFAPPYFEWPAGWWRVAISEQGQRVGFVLPVCFKDRSRWRDGRPQGTILYMGVLPAHRGRGHARALLDEATRLFVAADCWRIFCDTGTSNLPMVKTFRQAGYQERAPWQRPLD